MSSRGSNLSPLLLGGFTVIGLHLFCLITTPVVVNPDSAFYIEGAIQFLERGITLVYPTRTPGYQWILSYLLWGTRIDLLAVSLFQHFLIIALAPAIFITLRPLLGNKPAFFAGILTGVDPALCFYSSYIMSDISFCFFVTCAVLIFIRAQRGTSPIRLVLIGILFGFATLIRPVGMVIFLLATCFYTYRPLFLRDSTVPPLSLRLKHCSMLSLSFFIVLLPWMLFRYLNFNEIGLNSKDANVIIVTEKMLGVDLLSERFFSDSEIRQKFIELKAFWDHPPPDFNKEGASFYFYLNPQLERLFGPERTRSAYRSAIWQAWVSDPLAYLAHAWPIGLFHLGIVPPPVARNLIPAAHWLESEIDQYLHHPDQYIHLVHTFRQEAVEALSLEHFKESMPGVQQSLTTYLAKISTWWRFIFTFIFLILWVSLYRGSPRTALSSRVIFIPAVVIVMALFHAALLLPTDRYSFVLNPLLYVEIAIIAHYLAKHPSLIR